MKYYAVTDDPRELMHYGIKGMKWGILRSPEQLGHHKPTKARASAKTKVTKQRSDAFQRAKEKLSAGMRNGIQKAKDNIREYRSPAAKAERSFQKHLQLARQGRLKYKGISDDEVYRIADRLALEKTSRNLSGAEPPSYLRRLRTAIQEGTIEGVGRGTSAYIDARMRGRGQTTAKIKDEKRMAKFHNSRQGRKAAMREAKAEADKEYYKIAAEEGIPIEGKTKTAVRNLIRGANQAYNEQATAAALGQRVPGTWDTYTSALASQDWSNMTRGGRARAVAASKRNAENEEFRKSMAKEFGKKYASELAKNKADAEKYIQYYKAYGNGDKASRLDRGSSSSVSNPGARTPDGNTRYQSTELIPYSRVRRTDSNYSTSSKKKKKKGNRYVRGEGSVR